MDTVNEGDRRSPGRPRKPCETILFIIFFIDPLFIISDNIDLKPLQATKNNCLRQIRSTFACIMGKQVQLKIFHEYRTS